MFSLLRGVVSVGDGPRDEATGRPLFYLSTMHETTQNILARPNASLTLTEAQLLPRGCGRTDPEVRKCMLQATWAHRFFCDRLRANMP